MICKHDNLVVEILDQTMGVGCVDCDLILGYCWGKNHCSEQLWNKLCLTDKEANPCEKNRDNFCFLCGKEF